MRMAIFISLALSASVPSARSEDPIGARVEAILKTPGYAEAQWGLLAVDLESGRVVYEKDADRMLAPASVTKLYSTSAALVDLGPDHRFKTVVRRKGSVDPAGVLQGDLILVASGDPCLGGRQGPDDHLLFEDNDHTYANGNEAASLVPANPLAGLDALARGVAASGVRRVEGEILIDTRIFEASPSSGSGPRRVSSIVINDNLIDVVITPGVGVGSPGSVRLVPESTAIRLDSRVTTSAEGVATSLAVREVADRMIVVRGSVPIGRRGVVRVVEVGDPASHARALLVEALRRAGVEIDASPLEQNPSDRLPASSEVSRLPKLAEFVSPRYREYARVILKVSHNLYASAQPLILAASHGESTLADGLRREGRILRELGLDLSRVSFGGGAGGAREDLTTPRATVALIRAMSVRPEWSALEGGLPILGVDGTLAKAVSPESPARGKVRAKSGTFWIDNPLLGRTVITSKALAGVLDRADGHRLAFAFFLNNVPVDDSGRNISEATAAAGRLLGRLCEVFVE